jgi:mitotic spindle assembly checkpoint protein MAD2B
MTPGGLVQYFRSFLIKINMIESVLGQLELGGGYIPALMYATPLTILVVDDISFGIIIELKNDTVPTASNTKVCPSAFLRVAC